MKNVICIVDAYSTGAALAPFFKQAGWFCIHVQSSPDITDEYLPSFAPENFDLLLAPASSQLSGFDGILDQLRRYQPHYIIPGTETGVETADYLSSLLATPGNSWKSSRLRRDKFAMQEALRQGGLAAIPQCITAHLDDALAWADAGQQWPVVVKPVDSAGADSVRFCSNTEELAQAFNHIIGKKNKLGLTNTHVLLQERLHGQQFIVNAVSMNGEHLITEIWSDDKILVSEASLICEKEILLPYHGEIQQRLIAYIKQALTLLGVNEGPSHSEIMWTEAGPVLIETAARMQGTIMHDAVITALGYSHVTLTAERYLEPEKFAQRLHQEYERKEHLFCVTLASKFDGVVVENRCEALINHLPSYFGMMHTPEKGEKIYRTRDLFTNPGIIYLCHNSEEQIIQDYKIIRQLENDGLLFELA